MSSGTLRKCVAVGVPVVIVGCIGYFVLRLLLSARNERVCFGNIRKIHTALNLYLQDYDEVFPIKTAWENCLPARHPDIFCPAARPKLAEVTNTGFYGYAINEALLSTKKASVLYPATTVMACESAAGVLVTSSPNPFPQIPPEKMTLEEGWKRHRGGSNYLFTDGHARWHTELQVRGVDDHDGNDGKRPTFSVSPGVKQWRERR